MLPSPWARPALPAEWGERADNLLNKFTSGREVKVKMPRLTFQPRHLLPWPHLTRLECELETGLEDCSGVALGLQLLAASRCAGKLRELRINTIPLLLWASCPLNLATAFPRLQKVDVRFLNSADDVARVAQLPALTSLKAYVRCEREQPDDECDDQPEVSAWEPPWRRASRPGCPHARDPLVPGRMVHGHIA